MTPNFYFISETRKSLSVRRRSWKKFYGVENFAWTSLRHLVHQRLLPQPNSVRWWMASSDCLDVQSKTEHVKKRKPFLAPYASPKDRRYVFFHWIWITVKKPTQWGFLYLLLPSESLTFSLPIEFYVKGKQCPIIINAFYFLTGLEIHAIKCDWQDQCTGSWRFLKIDNLWQIFSHSN